MRRWLRFSRSTATSLFTTVLDFGVLVTMVQLFHVNYILATWFGTVVGSLSNFTINRYWAFKDSRVPGGHQFARFVAVQAGASALHTGGVWVFTRFLGIPYQISKLIIAALVMVGWNYPMNRRLVFSTNRLAQDPSTPPPPTP
jgi:putative flippase GtrA